MEQVGLVEQLRDSGYAEGRIERLRFQCSFSKFTGIQEFIPVVTLVLKRLREVEVLLEGVKLMLCYPNKRSYLSCSHGLLQRLPHAVVGETAFIARHTIKQHPVCLTA